MLVTDTSVGESQPMDTTAAYSACPSGTSALATACWICWTMSSLSNWEVKSCTLASSLSGTATSLRVPPAVVTVMVSTSSKSTEPVESPVSPVSPVSTPPVPPAELTVALGSEPASSLAVSSPHAPSAATSRRAGRADPRRRRIAMGR